MNLSNPKLLRQQAYINAQWVHSNSGATFIVQNPADGSTLAELPEMGQVETAHAIAMADAAFPAWRDFSPNQRKAILDKWVNLIQQNIDDLAIILSSEQGKPLSQAKMEYDFTLERMSFLAGESLRVHGQTLPSVSPDKRSLVIRQPFGVIAGVAPWNFPASTVMMKVAAALAAGNTMVVKPAQDTPLTTLAMVYLGEQAGLPAGVLNVVLANNPVAIGNELTTNPLVRKFSFTGSTAVGKKLYAQCASTVKNVALELGGNSPFIVFADADIDAAATQGAALKFTNCGQICVNANRFLVAAEVYDEFVEKMASHAKAHVLGSGLDAKTTMGPLINAQGFAKVDALVKQAIAEGAHCVTGGEGDSVGELFYQPTVLSNMTPEMTMYHQEIFGPVAPIYKFDTEAEAIAMANDTEYGLAAYFFTNDLGRSWRVSSALQAGTVNVNSASSFGGGPFGGYKESGLGREQGRVSALDAWCEVKAVNFSALD
jgi:succinate-semialdehyde dehydrogenase/glutarate-semialdehyde dehydrogenase